MHAIPFAVDSPVLWVRSKKTVDVPDAVNYPLNVVPVLSPLFEIGLERIDLLLKIAEVTADVGNLPAVRRTAPELILQNGSKIVDLRIKASNDVAYLAIVSPLGVGVARNSQNYSKYSKIQRNCLSKPAHLISPYEGVGTHTSTGIRSIFCAKRCSVKNALPAAAKSVLEFGKIHRP
jgi:hypothetical protein